MTRRELERMVQALTDGSLSEVEHGQLQAELRANAGSRAFFRRSMEVEMLLIEALGPHAVIDQGQRSVKGRVARQQRKLWTQALMATAAVFVLAGLFMALIRLNQPARPTLTGTPVPGTQWLVTGEAASGAREVAEGASVVVSSGAVKLELDSGMVMVVRGPAEVFFPTLEHPVLKRGWLWIDSGDAGGTITLETRHELIRNLGTRFGVRVRDNGQTEIHLIHGRVRVAPKDGGAASRVLRPDGRGVVFSPDGGMAVLPVAPDPFPTLPELLAAVADYRTTLLSQSPVGYWRLDERSGEQLANEVAEGLQGLAGTAVDVGQGGVGPEHGFHGFPPGNLAVGMSGDKQQSVLMHLDKPGGVRREEGAVSFWIRRPAGAERDEVLWLAGDGVRGAISNPKTALIHTRMTASGRIELCIENGGLDVVLASNFSIADDRWHHVAASWGADAVELYVNGRRVARADDFGELTAGITSGRYVRFGKPSNDLETQGKAAFAGAVDEIAVWSRPLTGAEVAHQYEAAKGMMKDTEREGD